MTDPAALEALEGRLINRLAEMEIRIVRDMANQWRWTIGLILPLYALIIAAILTSAVAAINILSKLP